MIDFERTGDALRLIYVPEWAADGAWLTHRLRTSGEVRIRKCFTFRAQDLVSPVIPGLTEVDSDAQADILDTGMEASFVFCLGRVEGDYYRLDARILGTDNPFFLHRDWQPHPRHFIAVRDISILRHVDRQATGPVYIGGPHEEAISREGYLNLLRRFPTTTELNHYAAARVEGSLRDYFETRFDAIEIYQQYLNRHLPASQARLRPQFAPSEAAKWAALRDHLKEMLDSEVSYSERDWQSHIVQVIQLLYPKYVKVLEKVAIRDTINSTWRYPDIVLVDACGYIDIIEIKKPFDRSVVSRSRYRANHVPARELAGAVMQIEKYLFYLSKWGTRGDQELNERYRSALPSGVCIRIVNPAGIVVLGREAQMGQHEREDFEVIKRKYRNIVDIITYDDLLRRLQVLVESFETAPTKDA